MDAEHLYIHVPFCGRRCVYCDFSIAVRPRVPVDEYVRSVEREWDRRHASSRLHLSTLYLGGGTPSKLGGEGVRRLMDVVHARAAIQPGAEITMEANPEDVTHTAARAWIEAGITRVSLGVQSFSDAVLRWMHRTHDAAQARRAVEVLRDTGLANISVDLIFGAPSNVEREWSAELDEVAKLGVDHVSVYGLTVEPHTPLGRWVARDDVREAPEESFEREFLAAHQALTDAGYEHYEVSNYGRSGRHSRHNWAYWERRPYAALGPSAHEFDGVRRRWNTGPYADWVQRLGHGDTSVAGEETLDSTQEDAESLYLSLRTLIGVQLSEEERSDIEAWVQAGWATVDDSHRLRITARGWLRLDALANHLTLLRSRSYI